MFEHFLCKRVLRRFAASALLIAMSVLITPPLEAAADIDAGAINPLQTASRYLIGTVALKKLVGKPIGEERILFPNKPPIGTTPFDVVDPQTKLPVPREKLITTPSGKQAPAGEYWDKINSLEAFANKRGQTLRGGSKKIDAGHVIGSSQSELSSSAQGSSDSGGPAGPAEPTVKTAPEPDAQVKPERTPVPNPHSVPDGFKQFGFKPLSPLPQKYNAGEVTARVPAIAKPYVKQYGREDLAAIKLTIGVSASADQTGPAFDAVASVGGYMFDGAFTLASATASANSKKAGVNVQLAGDTVLDESQPLPYEKSFDKTVSFFDISTQIPVWIFVISISASASGSAGLDVTVKMRAPEGSTHGQGPNLDAMAKPYAAVNVSLAVGFGVGTSYFNVNAGINGNLQPLVEISAPITFNAKYYVAAHTTGSTNKAIWGCQAHFLYSLSADLKATILAGSADVFVQGCFLFCDTLVDEQIFNWSGITKSTTIFSKRDDIDAGPLFSDEPEYGYRLRTGWGSQVLYSPDDADYRNGGKPEACDVLRKQIGAKDLYYA